MELEGAYQMDKESMAIESAIVSSRLKPAELARAMGVSPGLIYQWRTGMRPVPAKHAPKLAELLGVKPEVISAGYADVRESAGNVVPLRDQLGEDLRRPDLIIARLENDIQTLRYALGALTAAMVAHRPAEATDVAKVLRKQVPAKFQDRGLLHELLTMLDKAGRGQVKG